MNVRLVIGGCLVLGWTDHPCFVHCSGPVLPPPEVVVGTVCGGGVAAVEVVRGNSKLGPQALYDMQDRLTGRIAFKILTGAP